MKNSIVTSDNDLYSSLEAVRQHLIAIVESSDDAIISKDLNGTIMSWNKGAERIFGYTAREVIGKSISILIPKDHSTEEVSILKRLTLGERINHYETVRQRKDGSLVDISLTVSPIRNAEGKVIGASKIARDITEYKRSKRFQLQAEDMISHERTQLRVLIDSLPDYIYFKDIRSRFIDANQATLRVMKCNSVEEIIGKTDFDFYPEHFAQKYFNDEREIISTGEPKIDMEEDLIDENMQRRVISTSKVPLRNAAGQITGLVGIGKDVTERKKMREVLERDKESLEKIVQLRTKELLEIQGAFDRSKRLSDIGTLAAIVAHELRNPLEVIKLSAHQLKKEKAFVENKYVLNIEKKLWESERIIDNLLNYSRIKIPTYELIDLVNLVDESVSYFPSNFEDHRIDIEKNYGVSSPLPIEVDPYQIREVFINIFNNACQALLQKNGKIEVSIQPQGEHFVCVAFKDNGVGISEDDLNKIFTPFYTSKTRGTGLGLAICKEFVDLHNGKIEVQSKKGVGTTFQVILPLRRI